MPSPTRLARLLGCAFATGVVVATAADVPGAATANSNGVWQTLTVPVSAARLCDAVDLPPPTVPENLLFNLIRVLHERPLAPAEFARGRAGPLLQLLRPGSRQEGADDDPRTSVPLPLAPETWANVILRRRLSPDDLAGAILADRRASLLYVGLSQVDAATLAALERMPAAIWTFGEEHASALAAFGGSLTIDERGVRLPGPPEMAPAWTALVGAPASDPVRFLPLLLERDRGRLAYFVDSLTRLDEAHQRFAFGAPDASADPLGTLTSLYAVFRRVSPEWDAALHPFYRPPLDPATVLSALRVDEEGRLVPAWPRAVWEHAFSGHIGSANGLVPAPGNGSVDAAWLLDAVLAPGPKGSHARAAQVRFAQRVFAGADAASEAPGAATAGYARYPALMLALETLGVSRPTVYVDAGRRAAALTRRDSTTALAIFQASLALVARSTWAHSVERPEGERLAVSLLALNAQADDYEARMAAWLTDDLLPALADATGADESSDAEAIVLGALAGVGGRARDETRALVEWYGRRYAVDAAAGALARFEQIRERQGPPTLDQALAMHGAIDALDQAGTRPEALRTLRERLSELGRALPDLAENHALRDAIGRAQTRLPEVADGRSLTGDVRRALDHVRGAVLADALTALAYLAPLGDPNGPARLGGHVARRHVFSPPSDVIGDGADPAWRLPSEVVTEDRGWHVEGSLLGLERALARLSLRRLDVDVIPLPPRVDETTRRLFTVDAALARVSDFSDADRDLIAAGLAAGRERVAQLVGEPERIDTIAVALGLEARRVQAFRWVLAETGPDLTDRFSFSELLRLGAARPLPFGVTTVPTDACPRSAPACPREASDLALRLVEGLAARRLPAALLPGLLGVATQDFVDQVQPSYPGDLDALRQLVLDLTDQRFDDYVAALEGSGALRPVAGSSEMRE